MKLWYSFIKEVKLAFKVFYFYIELLFAVIILAVLLFLIPENFNNTLTEYLYFDVPAETNSVLTEALQKEDTDGMADAVKFKIEKELISATYYETIDKKIYVMKSESDLIKTADNKNQLGIVVKLNESGTFSYKYYLQGYETNKQKNLFLVLLSSDLNVLEATIDKIDVRPLSTDYRVLNDREYTLPSLLTFNGSLMCMFILAAYIFFDKDQGIIKAYAVTPSPVWHYLLSKVLVVTLTVIITTILIVFPIMLWRPDYILILILVITSSFFASSVGLLVAGFYDSIAKAFNTIYLILVVMMLPGIAYIIPSWEPAWIRVFPTYYMIQGFKESIVKGGNTGYVLLISVCFLFAGLLLFIWANHQHKKNLTA